TSTAPAERWVDGPGRRHREGTPAPVGFACPAAAPTYTPTRRRRMRPIGRAPGGGMSGPGESLDRDWSRRLVAGDEHVLREVYRANAPAVLGLATRVLGNATAAEDVLQDVFVRLWEKPETYDPERGRLRSYLLAMTHSRAVERLRAEDSQRRRLAAAQQNQ